MGKSYTEQLAKWVEATETSRRDKNVVAFLAVRDDVQAAINSGYAVKTIWRNMRDIGRVTFGYDTFLNYVNRFLEQTPVAPLKPAEAPPTPPPVVVKPAPSSKRKEAASTGFKFNPLGNPRDLL